MSIVIADRVKETTTTTGTGTVDLDGASVGFQGFVAGVGDGAEVYYCIAGQAGGGAAAEWETGIGTVTDAATDTLSRDTVLASSNSGSLVNFASGTKDVFLTMPAQGNEVVVATASPSAVANVDFTLPSGFTLFRLEGWLSPATDNAIPYLRMKRSGEASFDTGSTDYTYSRETYIWGGAHSVASVDASYSPIAQAQVGSASGEYVAFDIKIFRALDAVPTRVIRHNTLIGADSRHEFGGSVHNFSVALAELRVLFSTGNIADGELRLIGIL